MMNWLDVNPQFISASVAELTINTFTQNTVPTPVLAQTGMGKSLVMEILKVFFAFTNPLIIAANYTRFQVAVCRKSLTSMPEFENADVLAWARKEVYSLAAAPTGSTSQIDPICLDLTDGAGNGILFAGKNIFAQIKGTNNAAGALGAATIKILYRLKQVDPSEIIGMLSE